MNLEVLISTMHQTDYSLLERIGLRSDAVVVNQCDRESEEDFNFDGYRIIWINSTQRGLSRSRNMAIKHSTADVMLLVDDDEMLKPDYVQTILDGFRKYPDATVIGFQIHGIEEKFKDYSLTERKVGYFRSMKMASAEIAISRERLNKTQVRFNERIGAGTKYLMNEDNTFLFDLLGQKQRIYYVPIVIADLHIGVSTWFSGFNKQYMVARGAGFAAMSKRWSGMLILQFAVRHYNLYSEEMTMLTAIRYMFNGKKEYLLEQNEL